MFGASGKLLEKWNEKNRLDITHPGGHTFPRATEPYTAFKEFAYANLLPKTAAAPKESDARL